ncbi:unnamed protein product [Paramecium primaurelia]|uniref:Transmembrane protein n=1 Tax=Paramecium primaurelia TaxID=5886 RepID=A0A8S1NL14_PARPR|nr:unnamed protein product [Paramecium primaurelia]CAD8090143.1 unnamed protein product [Paramecium primaurelia]
MNIVLFLSTGYVEVLMLFTFFQVNYVKRSDFAKQNFIRVSIFQVRTQGRLPQQIMVLQKQDQIANIIVLISFSQNSNPFTIKSKQILLNLQKKELERKFFLMLNNFPLFSEFQYITLITYQ